MKIIFLDNLGIKNKKMGFLFLLIGLSVLFFLIYNAGLFSSFSLSRVASLFFDDLEVVPLIISVALILFGSYILTRK